MNPVVIETKEAVEFGKTVELYRGRCDDCGWVGVWTTDYASARRARSHDARHTRKTTQYEGVRMSNQRALTERELDVYWSLRNAGRYQDANAYARECALGLAPTNGKKASA